MDYEKHIKPYDHIITSVASEYHRKFDMCDLEDIKQSLYEWFLEHPNKLESWTQLGGTSAKNLIFRSLRNQALDYCQAWKAKSLGYEVDDLFYYTPEMIENLLPAVLLDDLDVLPVVNLGKTGGGKGAPAESGNLATMLAEIKLGYGRLSDDDKKILFMRFALSYGFIEIAAETDIKTEDAARMRVRRAVKKLVVKSGGFKPQREDDDEAPSAERLSTDETPSSF